WMAQRTPALRSFRAGSPIFSADVFESPEMAWIGPAEIEFARPVTARCQASGEIGATLHPSVRILQQPTLRARAPRPWPDSFDSLDQHHAFFLVHFAQPDFNNFVVAGLHHAPYEARF